MTSPASPTPTSANATSLASPLASGPVTPISGRRREFCVSNCLQVVVIVALLASAVYLAFYADYRWSALLALAGLALGAVFLQLRAPNWLQALVIVALLASALYVAFYEHYLWSALLALAGLAFGASYLLRHMVGDDYGRV